MMKNKSNRSRYISLCYKDRFKASKFFITADLGASCLGWLAGFFILAVALGFIEQHKLIQLPDILRRYLYQLFIFIALISLYLKGWRGLWRLDGSIAKFSFAWLLGYLVILKIIDWIAMGRNSYVAAGAPLFLFDDQILLAGVIAPILEELFFRDLLFRTFISKWPKFWIAVLATSFFFMVAHQSFYMGAFLLGVINSLLFIYSGSVVPGILFHSLSNLSWYFLPKLYPHLFELMKDGGWLNLFYRS